MIEHIVVDEAAPTAVQDLLFPASMPTFEDGTSVEDLALLEAEIATLQAKLATARTTVLRSALKENATLRANADGLRDKLREVQQDFNATLERLAETIRDNKRLEDKMKEFASNLQDARRGQADAERERDKIKSDFLETRQNAPCQETQGDSGFSWQFEVGPQEWSGMPSEVNTFLMERFAAFQKGGTPQIALKSGASKYNVDFTNMLQTNERTGTVRKIRCEFRTPAHWKTNVDLDRILPTKRTCVQLDGFGYEELNGFYIECNKCVSNGESTYWKEDGTHVIYFLDCRWAVSGISPRVCASKHGFYTEIAWKFGFDLFGGGEWESKWNVFGESHAFDGLREDRPCLMDIATPIWDASKLNEFAGMLSASVSHKTARIGQSDCDKFRAKMKVHCLFQIENWQLWRRYKSCLQLVKEDIEKFGVEPASITPLLTEALVEFGEARGVDMGVNEVFMFHGTSFEAATKVALDGFDFRLSEPGYYGRGTYFASQACKSHMYTVPEDPLVGMRTIIVSRVALGDFCCAEEVDTERCRPPMREGSHRLYDTVIAKPGLMRGHHAWIQTHLEAIIFEKAQAYPEYIVQYTME
eukprot:TRINITY_DN33785_c0_g1_i1.p1 TRINITY_DN33785_c0_g1~~TRINITY_DN33785_c0_g1_i1.p1  ORF type:complete len:586 (-),score=97.57 TRINITY_DN33785_c0_g1_i1:58-1815(-)